ncbi:hypothetical protein Bca101_007863 [Brassica carinata]
MKVISITFKSIYDPQRVGRRQGKRDISRNTERTHPTRPWGYVVIRIPDEILDLEEAIKYTKVIGLFNRRA